MPKKTSQIQESQKPQLGIENQKLIYRQPQIVNLGSLEQVQAGSSGSRYDGPDRTFYYS